MALADTVTNQIPETLHRPALVVVGAADTAVEAARQMPVRLQSVRRDVVTGAASLREETVGRVEHLRASITELPSKAGTSSEELTARLEALPVDVKAAYDKAVTELIAQYETLGRRGDSLVSSVRSADATKRAEHQVKSATTKVKAARTSIMSGSDRATQSVKAAATSVERAGEQVMEAAKAAIAQVGR